MFFSICVPTYNRAYIIQRTLNSILSQTFKDYEVILVDDGSTDNTGDVVESYLCNENWHYIYKENGGKHTVLNEGIKQAKGEMFIILDSDDSLIPDALESMYVIWDGIKNKDEFCGVMGRGVDQKGEWIGK